jgi:hypothetical protein
MKAEDSYQAFRSRLKQRGLTQKTLSLSEAIELMADFYASEPAENCQASDGDGLAFYYAHIRRGSSTPFEVGMMRLYRPVDMSNPAGGSRLRMSFNYPWWETVIASGLIERLKPAAPEGNRFCWSPRAVGDLLEYVHQHETFLSARNLPHRSVTLKYEPVWGVYA